MRYPAFVRAAALALPAALFFSGAVQAQAQAAAATQPQPTVLSDAAPLPAQERTSSGAVILMDEPVLAQRQQMEEALARAPGAPDTRSMGAGPARLATRPLTKEEIDAIERGSGMKPR
ncbi:hypothetical protein LZ009_17400 [Ramlibacter sp. XY19]|uniref:hypothetical protein n=1 Tax=Ramlibacter paludis TaxID=2908000 RepID=UPI0023DC80C1|nr:hypothetical protein [Ramlibacter paludis]MCG2594556.1 hypothetical protein [Ramlibacter paludis]